MGPAAPTPDEMSVGTRCVSHRILYVATVDSDIPSPRPWDHGSVEQLDLSNEAGAIFGGVIKVIADGICDA